MPRSGFLVSLAAVLAVWPACVVGQAGLILNVSRAPTPVKAEEGVHLVYELYLINRGRDVEVKTIEVLGEDDAVLVTYQDSALWQLLERPGTMLTASERSRIAGGAWALAWLWVTLDQESSIPASIRHRVTTEHVTRAGTTLSTVRVGGRTAPVAGAASFGPPLRGGNWRAGYLSNESHHRRGGPSGTNGAVSERFAIDYNRHDEFGLNSRGDRFHNESYYAWGAEVLAVDDAAVVQARDGLADNVPLVPNGEILSTGLGNWVELDLGDGLYAGYAHLQQGSVRVSVGDTVEMGEALGRVGNSGNSNGPHLHFYVQDAPTVAGARFREAPEGLPYVHPSYQVVGSGGSPFCSCSGGRCATQQVAGRQMEMPMRDLLVRFTTVDDPDDDPAFRSPGTTRHAALCRVMEGRLLLDQRRVAEAMAAFLEAEVIDPRLTIPAWHWARLCQVGSLWDTVPVLSACDRAVALEPENGEWRRFRGIALALADAVDEAAVELERYVRWEPRSDLRAQHQGWVDSLRAGLDPFTPEVLQDLQAAVPSAMDWRGGGG